LDEGSIGVSIQSVDLENVVSPLIEELRVVSQSKGISLDYIPSSLCVESDPGLLTRILRNLIGNAIKYTEVGSVVVTEIKEGSSVILSVSDTGVGIAKQELSSIFDEYHQIANKKRQRNEGIGLGLSIVKKTARLLGHPVSVSSELEKGSTFSLTAPLCSESNTKPVSNTSKVASMTGVKVLVVDDETDTLNAMQSVLENWGCEVRLAETPEQARDSVAATHPDIIFSDYRLHESLNGIELLHALKQEFDIDIPCIIISGDKSETLIRNAEQNGFPYLAKPVNIAVMNSLLTRMLPQNENKNI